MNDNFLIREINDSDLINVSVIVRKAMMKEVLTRNMSDEAIEKSFNETSPQKLIDRIKGNFFTLQKI